MGRKENYEWKNFGLVGRDGWCRVPPGGGAFVRRYSGWSETFSPGQLTSTTTYPGFTVTVLTAGTLVMGDVVGGCLNLTGGGADGQGIQMQSMGEFLLPAADNDIWFEASIQAADADDIDWMLGVASRDANIFSTDPTEIIAFRGDDGDLNVDFQVRNGGTGAQTDTATDVADATTIVLGFHVVGATSVKPFINGSELTAVTTNIPTAEMALTFGMLDGATTANNTFGLNWARVLQLS